MNLAEAHRANPTNPLLVEVREIEMEARVHFLLLALFVNSIHFCMVPSTEAISLGNDTDRLALLAFKDGIVRDPTGALSSWNESVHFCAWEGVTCGHKNPDRVTVLDLSNRGLAGSISPSIGNLSFLTRILLMENELSGEIPSEIGRLQSLRLLNLSFNSLDGAIPTNLSYCSQLVTIQFRYNHLSSGIPPELGSLSNLKSLAVDNNSLTGVLPPALGNLSSLVEFSAMYNGLRGSIPYELGDLVNLSFFQASGNLLSGTIPSSFFNLSSLYYFSVAGNNLHGTLPPSMGNNLPQLQVFSLGINQFTGPIPASLSNASSLQLFAITRNNFSGEIPPDLGRLQNLAVFNVISNQLEASNADGWRFLDSLTNCTQLQMLYIGVNQLGGTLPSSIANLSTTLTTLMIGFNPMTGRIPSGIQNLINLDNLDMSYSLLSGPIPDGIGRLAGLQVLGLAASEFAGQIPPSIGNLSQLIELNLLNNQFQGKIPASLGYLQKLTVMDLSNNSLSGSIPKQMFNLTFISNYMDLSNNLLNGSLPQEVGNLKQLGQLGVSGNKLSGEIPATFGNCESMEFLALNDNLLRGAIPPALSNMKGLKTLDLSHNILSGTIPPSFSNLRSLQELDLSRNNLSGPIPTSLQDLASLLFLNLSYNQLQGEVPAEGVFRNSSAISLLGNEGLCGGISQIHLPKCPTEATKKRKGLPLWLKIFIPIAAVACIALLLFTLFALLRWKRSPTKKSSDLSSLEEERYPRITYAELAKATDGFSSDNLIGSGRYGSVYKGRLGDGRAIVAVKVFKLEEQGASKSFLAECKALRNIRHRNLIKILTSCSSLDPQGNDFKALVFEFMPNGNLESWLHPEAEEDERHQLNHLSLLQRLNIAVDTADALEYLHHSCQPPVVHCDLKPSNVLLDDGMNARVGDFGLAKFLSEAASKSLKDASSSIGIKGTVGYVAPEYGAGDQVSTAGDVYSYGVLLMEMFTGKRPTNDMFKDSLSLRGFVQAGASRERVMEIAGQTLLFQSEGHDEQRNTECLISVLKIGLSCSDPSPRGRMSMADAAAKMRAVRGAYLGNAIHKTESQSEDEH